MVFRRLELDNRRLENWNWRHREFSEIYDETLNRRALRLPKAVDELIIEEEQAELLRKAIAALPEIQRQRFLLYYEYEYNYYEIAAMEHCTASSIGQSITREQTQTRPHRRGQYVLGIALLRGLRRVLFYVQAFEKQFVQEQLEKSSKEQKSLKEAVTMLRNEIEAQDDKTANVLAFVEKVKRYTEIKELTPAIVNEFIDYIMVSKKQVIDDKTVYPIDIYYNGVGIITAPSAEEYEEMFF